MRAGAAAAYRLVLDRGTGRHRSNRIAAQRSRCNPACAVRSSGRARKSVALMGYRTRCGRWPQHGRSRGCVRRRRSQPRRRGADNLHPQQAGQAYRRARRDGVGGAFHRRRSPRDRRLRRSRFNRGQHQSHVHGPVGRPDSARGDTRTASGPRRLLPDGEGGLRLAQSADGSIARRADAGAGRGAAASRIDPDLFDRARLGRRWLGVRCALLGAQSQGAGAFFSVGAAPARRWP